MSFKHGRSVKSRKIPLAHLPEEVPLEAEKGAVGGQECQEPKAGVRGGQEEMDPLLHVFLAEEGLLLVWI